MKTNVLKNLFEGVDFDIAEPSQNHEVKFREKLKRQRLERKKPRHNGIITMLLPGLAIAASFLIAFVLFQGVFSGSLSQPQGLASVSPEMKQTQDFYASVIKTELASLQQQKTPETEAVINDALKQLEILENDYEKLKQDLNKSGQDKRVIYAMISNFQKRIDLLNMVLEKVNTINTLNNSSHENNVI